MALTHIIVQKIGSREKNNNRSVAISCSQYNIIGTFLCIKNLDLYVSSR